jgi:hypothetical protein
MGSDPQVWIYNTATHGRYLVGENGKGDWATRKDKTGKRREK